MHMILSYHARNNKRSICEAKHMYITEEIYKVVFVQHLKTLSVINSKRGSFMGDV